MIRHPRKEQTNNAAQFRLQYEERSPTLDTGRETGSKAKFSNLFACNLAVCSDFDRFLSSSSASGLISSRGVSPELVVGSIVCTAEEGSISSFCDLKRTVWGACFSFWPVSMANVVGCAGACGE